MKKIFHVIRFSILGQVLPLMSFAQGIENPLKSNPHTVLEIFNLVMPKVNAVAGMIAAVSLIYNGYLFAKARGNPKELETAQKYFEGTIIGLLIILGANLVVGIITATIANLT